MKQIVPEFAQIGDDVVTHMNMIGSIAGTSTQNDCLMVKWDAVPGVDVIGIGSPVWSQFKIYRDEPAQTITAIALDVPLVTQCPDCGADVPTIFEHVGGCPEQPTCNHDGVNTENLAEQEVLAQHGFAIIAQSGVEADESDLVPLAAPGSAFNVLPSDEIAFKLPWSDDDLPRYMDTDK